MRNGFLIALLASLHLSVGTARADDAATAKQHYNSGIAKYSAGKYEEAAKDFIDAYVGLRVPDALYNAGLAYEKLGDAGKATALYKRYLTERKNAPERREIDAKLARMAPKVATVTIVSEAGADVAIDGVPVGQSPVGVQYLTAGKHTFEARREGFQPGAVEVVLVGRDVREIRVEPTAPAPAPPEQPPPTASDDGPRPLAPELVRPSDKENPEAKPSRKWLWPVVGVGAAVVIAGVTTALVFTLGPDYAANARSQCTGGCVLFDGSTFVK